MTDSKPGQLYVEGKLAEALAAAAEEVKQHPTETDHRWLLCELLCFVGELERANTQLETIGKQDPASMFSVTVFRNLIRAEAARRKFFRDGDLPEILGERTPVVDLQLEAVQAAREGRVSDARQALASVDEQRVHATGTCDGGAFDDLRDADDMTASVFEVFSMAGGYCWIPIEQVQSIEFGEVNRMTDLLWRTATLVAVNGPEAQVYLPALYCGTHEAEDDQLRLGRGTDWSEEEALTRGIGQRIFLVGDQGRPILEVNSINFESAAS